MDHESINGDLAIRRLAATRVDAARGANLLVPVPI